MDYLIDDLLFQQFNEDDFFVMNIDDFLAENDLQKEKFGNALKVKKKLLVLGRILKNYGGGKNLKKNKWSWVELKNNNGLRQNKKKIMVEGRIELKIMVLGRI